MKITTKQNLKVVKDFQKHTYINQSKPIVFLMAFLFLIGVLACLIQEYTLGGTLCFFVVLYCLVYPLLLYVANKKLNKSYKTINDEKIIVYEFLDNNYIVRTFKDEEEIEMSKNEYSKIYKIDETNDYLFIYVSNNMAYCLPKKEIKDGELSELKVIINKNNIKYKVTKR